MRNSRRDHVVRRPDYAVGSVDNALQLLDLLMDDDELTVTRAADSLHVARSTAHRLLSTLVYRGFAERTASRTYLLGPAVSERGGGAGGRTLVARVRPVLQRLAGETGETVNFVEVTGLDARFLVSAEGAQRVRVSGRAGTVLPSHLTSATKPCLAMMPWQQVRALLTSRAARDGGRSLDEKALEVLRRELAETARTGLARNRGMTEPDVSAIGVGVRGADGRFLHGISVSAPTMREDGLDSPDVVRALHAAAEDIALLIAGSH